MGLDITAYSKLEMVDVVYDADGDPIDPVTREPLGYPDTDLARVYVNPDFPERADGLARGYYLYGETLGFRAGSYSYYSRWREELAGLAGYPESPGEGLLASRHPRSSGVWQSDGGGPFWELINFSDCEGAIGPETSAKLAKDFADFRERLSREAVSFGFTEGYDNFEQAFRLAADGGAVCFH